MKSNQQSNPPPPTHTFEHMSPISRNPRSTPGLLSNLSLNAYQDDEDDTGTILIL